MFREFYKNWISVMPGKFWITGIIFILFNSMAIYYNVYYLLPLGLLPLISYYGIFDFDKIYFFSVFATPLSIALEKLFPGLGFNISLPSEVFFILLLFIVLVKIVRGSFIGSGVFRHPISIAILFYLFWMFITSISSSMPLVSFKHFIAQCWFIFPLFFLPVVLFREHRNILSFFGLYIVSFTFVIIYTIYNQLSIGLFDSRSAHFVMQPFYNDHTSYGAMLAMYVPVLFGLLFYKSFGTRMRLVIALFALFYMIALVLSYTRAAWISILGAASLALIVYLRIKVRYIAALFLLTMPLLYAYRIEIVDKLSRNKQDSSVEFSDHVKSISNIATDASNLERINRWNSAIRMFKERPILGWGPGTYMFQYAPYQMARDKTIISTNFAEGGNAHSEYLGPLTEMGVLGLFSIIAIMLTFFFTALRLYFTSRNRDVKLLTFISILSFTTYAIHGLLNNYLDTDKAAVPFWGMLAIVCSLDVYGLRNENPQLGGAEER